MTDHEEDDIIIGARQKTPKDSGLVIERVFSLPLFSRLLLHGASDEQVETAVRWSAWRLMLGLAPPAGLDKPEGLVQVVGQHRKEYARLLA